MKIAVAGPRNPDSFADNVGDTLKRMGHDTHMLGAARPPLRIQRASNLIGILSDHGRSIDRARQRRMVADVQRLRPELFITVDRRIHPSVIDAVHAGGGRAVLWFPDHTSTMGNHDMFLAGYDRIYLKNPRLADDLAKIEGLPVSHMSEAANSAWHRSRVEYGTERVIVMAGNVHPTRAVLLDRLIGDGIPVRIYGRPMPSWINLPRVRAAHTRQYLSRQEKADTFRSARAVLNNLHPAENAGMNCRLFEAAASGAAVVTQNRTGLSDLFSIGQEVIGFESYAELRTHLWTLLESPEAGRSLADAAAVRAHGDHTYEVRLGEILRSFG